MEKTIIDIVVVDYQTLSVSSETTIIMYLWGCATWAGAD